MSPPTIAKCRTCKVADSENGECRCAACHAKYRAWLDGGAVYQPMWNGVIGAPSDADKPVSRLDRALAKKKDEQ